MKIVPWLVLLLVGVQLIWVGRVANRFLISAAGLSAKHMCSLVFVSDLPLERAREWYLNPLLTPFHQLVSVDQKDHAFESRALWQTARAEYRPYLGCTLRYNTTVELVVPDGPGEIQSQSRLASTESVSAGFDIAALTSAVDALFESDKAGGTLAVLVQHKGEIVSERYVDGITHDTSLPGWSLAKSVTATLFGILVKENLIDVHAPGALSEWRGTADPRAEITVDNLLRMTSGLDISESHSGVDKNSRMLFSIADAADFAANQPVKTRVGDTYSYMSGNYVLAMRVLAQAVAQNSDDAFNFMQRELFSPLGLESVVFETDEAGTFIGSSFMLASARDWAQLAQLYLNDGSWNGKQIIGSDWMDYVTEHTPQSGSRGYGAGFWLTGSGDSNLWPGVPEDAFFMEGIQGQYVIIIPSEELVVVRLGGADDDDGIQLLVKQIVESKTGSSASADSH